MSVLFVTFVLNLYSCLDCYKAKLLAMKYIETTNSIKFRDDEFIIVVPESDSNILSYIKLLPYVRHVPTKPIRFKVPLKFWIAVKNFGISQRFYFTPEAVTAIKEKHSSLLQQTEN